jgi:hypothetical protein
VLGVALVRMEARGIAEVEQAFEAAAAEGVDGVFGDLRGGAPARFPVQLIAPAESGCHDQERQRPLIATDLGHLVEL